MWPSPRPWTRLGDGSFEAVSLHLNKGSRWGQEWREALFQFSSALDMGLPPNVVTVGR